MPDGEKWEMDVNCRVKVAKYFHMAQRTAEGMKAVGVQNAI